jgi:Protein of unknown function (DUF3618)
MSSDPDQIRDEINQTQRNLSADVDALTEKISPPRIVERRVQATRDAMTNVKDKIMGSTSQGTSQVRETMNSQAAGVGQAVTDRASTARDTAAATVSSAAGAARSAPDMVRRQATGNPVAAGLIAFGAGWLLSSLIPASTPEQQVATQVKDFATEHGRPVAQQLGEAGQQAAQQLRESAQQRAESVKDTAADAASTVSDEAHGAAAQVSSQAQDAAGTVREQAGSSGA